ncbi:sialic acid-binding Ig-like lectin 11 isoform X2 [Phacochoerus africanus]|uniref:sialic acid-binding Ig-like lectin 11 isoform X2 n=1 Tax=Phacochoerus africanus TaxID=41426 RepID=UPI001FD9CA53|nr:sialic acid-binding Ig-like lectin 11 isoform X2 [Phacochoerus africanus]
MDVKMLPPPLLLLLLLHVASLQRDPWYQLQVQESVTVPEGLCVLVPCTVSYPWTGWNDATPTYGYWMRKEEKPQNDVLVATNHPVRASQKRRKFPFDLSGDPGANNCSLSIRDARKRDSGNYYFRLVRGAEVKYSFRHSLLTVNVTALTWTPDIYIKEPLASGSGSHLTCSLPGACDWATPPTISWMGAALDASAASNSSEILLTPRPQDHGTNLTCRVTLPRAGVSTERTLQLNVSYAPRNLAIGISRGNCTELKYLGNGSSLPVLEGESLCLVCVVDSNPPATLSWARRGRILSPSQPWNPGVLQLPRVESGHEGEFTCGAQHLWGSVHVSLHLSVQNPPKLLGPFCSWEDEGLHCSCSSQAQPIPSLRWRLGEGLLDQNLSNASIKVTSSSTGPWANSSLSFREGLSSSLRLSCEAQNVHGAQSTTVLLLPGRPRVGGGLVLGAVGGAGIAGLLSLCSCLIFFIVKTFRKAAGEDAPASLATTSLGYQHGGWPGSPLDQPPPTAASPTAGEERELHYASLIFHVPRPWEPQDPEATRTTEYAEIKIQQ